MLESSIKELTEAVNRLATVLSNGSQTQPAESAPETAPPAKATGKKAGKKAEPESPPVAPPASEEDPDIDDLRRVLVKMGPTRGKELLAGFGAERLTEVDPARYAEVMARAREALALGDA
jgi:hypothetical protein